MTSNIPSNVRTGRLFRNGAYTDERRWVPAEDYERLQAIVERNKASAVHRLHNICDALSEDAKESPFTREEWERIDKQTVEHLSTIQKQGDEIERLRAALERYGRHTHPNCHDLTLKADGSFGPRNGCLCGFDAVLSADSSAPETGADELGNQIYALLVRRGYTQHEAYLIAGGPGCTSDCVRNGEPDYDCPAHGKRAQETSAPEKAEVLGAIQAGQVTYPPEIRPTGRWMPAPPEKASSQCQHDLLKPGTTIEVDGEYNAKCSVCKTEWSTK